MTYRIYSMPERLQFYRLERWTILCFSFCLKIDVLELKRWLNCLMIKKCLEIYEISFIQIYSWLRSIRVVLLLLEGSQWLSWAALKLEATITLYRYFLIVRLWKYVYRQRSSWRSGQTHPWNETGPLPRLIVLWTWNRKENRRKTFVLNGAKRSYPACT